MKYSKFLRPLFPTLLLLLAFRAAAPTHYIVSTYQVSSGSIGTATNISDVAELNLDVVVPATTTNLEVDVTITTNQMHSCCLFAAQTVTVLLNTTNVPAQFQGLTNAAGIPQIWNGVGPNLLNTNVTKFFLTNPGGTNTTWSFRSIIHNTNP